MPFNPFKDSATKAQDEFSKAYTKGVNLGPDNWQSAANSFSAAAKHFAEAGDSQKANEALALSALFQALVSRDPQSWQQCGIAMSKIGSTQLNVGFPANSHDIALQAQLWSEDLSTLGMVSKDSRDAAQAGIIRNFAQRYLEQIGTDSVIWKLMKLEMDPQRRAYYLLGLASLIEANSVIQSDPSKGVSLLSESAAHFEMAGIDPMNLRAITNTKRDNAAKLAKCWFCGREVQGLGTHYFLFSASVSAYSKQKFGSDFPPSIDGENIVACEGCGSSIRWIADMFGRMYYEKAMEAMAKLESKLQSEIDYLQSQINSIRVPR